MATIGCHREGVCTLQHFEVHFLMFLQPLELLSKRSSKNRAQRRSAASRAILRSGVQHRSLCDPAPARGGKGIRVRTFLCPYLVTNLKPRMRNGRITLVQHVERPHNPGYNMQRHTSMLTRALEEAACTASLAVSGKAAGVFSLGGVGGSRPIRRIAKWCEYSNCAV